MPNRDALNVKIVNIGDKITTAPSYMNCKNISPDTERADA